MAVAEEELHLAMDQHLLTDRHAVRMQLHGLDRRTVSGVSEPLGEKRERQGVRCGELQ